MKKFDLDEPLIELVNGDKKSLFTINTSLEGTQVFGSTGSGKSTGAGKTLAINMLKKRFGGIVLCVKKDEVSAWKNYCKIAGRESDLVILEPGGKHYFNFLEYETKSSDDNLLTDNILSLLKTVIASGESKDSGRENDGFWSSALDQLIANVVELSFLAFGKVSVDIMYDIVQTIPSDKKDLEAGVKENRQKPFFIAFEKAQRNVDNLVKAWYDTVPQFHKDRMERDGTLQETIVDKVPRARMLKIVDQFFMETYVTLSDKTRSIVTFSFSGFLFRLLREPAYSLFCKHSSSTVIPEQCFEGKIVVLNIPVKEYHKVGRDCQVIFKYAFQKAVEKRPINDYTRPVFLWSDENQFFLMPEDTDFQTTCRSSRVACVYLTQNLANYYANMGGVKSVDRVTSYLGSLNTKIFHCNADVGTNKYASELIGEHYVEDVSKSINKGRDFSQGRNTSSKLERIVRPEHFAKLKSGGKKNDFKVEAYMHRQGDVFPNGQNHRKIIFNQNFNS